MMFASCTVVFPYRIDCPASALLTGPPSHPIKTIRVLYYVLMFNDSEDK